jgi:hypothetical protein
MSGWVWDAVEVWRMVRFPAFVGAGALLGLLAYHHRKYLEVRARFLAGHDLPYRARGPLLTPTENRFYRVLRKVLPLTVAVTPKVRLADIITCDDPAWRAGYGGKIAQKHVDFVLVDRGTTEVLLVVELDDRSHRHPKRRERDAFVDRALRRAQVPILHVQVADEYPLRRVGAADLGGREWVLVQSRRGTAGTQSCVTHMKFPFAPLSETGAKGNGLGAARERSGGREASGSEARDRSNDSADERGGDLPGASLDPRSRPERSGQPRGT